MVSPHPVDGSEYGPGVMSDKDSGWNALGSQARLITIGMMVNFSDAQLA